MNGLPLHALYVRCKLKRGPVRKKALSQQNNNFIRLPRRDEWRKKKLLMTQRNASKVTVLSFDLKLQKWQNHPLQVFPAKNERLQSLSAPTMAANCAADVLYVFSSQLLKTYTKTLLDLCVCVLGCLFKALWIFEMNTSSLGLHRMCLCMFVCVFLDVEQSLLRNDEAHSLLNKFICVKVSTWWRPLMNTHTHIYKQHTWHAIP